MHTGAVCDLEEVHSITQADCWGDSQQAVAAGRQWPNSAIGTKMSLAAYLPHIFTSVFGALLVWEARSLLLAMASRKWRQTTGLVSKAFVSESSDADADVTHSAHVIYSYKIASNHYESKRLTYRPTSGLVFSKAADLLDGIVQGREVKVFYDPDRPGRSVLVPGASADNFVRISLLLVAFVFSLRTAI